MITAKMTDREIIAELDRDIHNVINKMMKREPDLRKVILKASRYPVSSAPYTVMSDNRNRWIVIFRAVKRSDRKAIHFGHSTFICTASFDNGLHAFLNSKSITPGKIGVGLAIFPPHFFSRYRLRFGVEKNGIDLLKHFFYKNYSLNVAYQEQYPNELMVPDRRIFGTSHEGVALGIVKSTEATLFKTFITYDMMYIDQEAPFTEKEEEREHGVSVYYRSLKRNI